MHTEPLSAAEATAFAGLTWNAIGSGRYANSVEGLREFCSDFEDEIRARYTPDNGVTFEDYRNAVHAVIEAEWNDDHSWTGEADEAAAAFEDVEDLAAACGYLLSAIDIGPNKFMLSNKDRCMTFSTLDEVTEALDAEGDIDPDAGPTDIEALHAEAEAEDEAEYEAGYNAFMLRCSGYAAAHAGGSWETYHVAGFDDRPVTPDYVRGWTDAQERIRREAGHCFGAVSNPRAHTATMREHAPDVFRELKRRYGNKQAA
jgi:hypothetical protein